MTENSQQTRKRGELQLDNEHLQKNPAANVILNDEKLNTLPL